MRGPLTPEPGDTGHVQVPVTSQYGVHAHVDEGIARLVEACWDVEIVTTARCQEVRPGGDYVRCGSFQGVDTTRRCG